MKRLFAGAVIGIALLHIPVASAVEDYDLEGTFSIIARDPSSGELGMGVQSKAFATATRTITVIGGQVAIAHQATSNPMYGAIGVNLLRAGMTPQQALDMMVRSDEKSAVRQVSILDIQGRTAAFTGTGSPDWKGHRCGTDYCAQGNTLVGPEVVEAIARSFESSKGPLAERMLAALDAGQAAGGDVRGKQAAGLVVAKPLVGAAGFGDRAVDIRVDDNRAPLVELRRLLNVLRSNQLATEANAKLRAGDLPGATTTAQAATEKSSENDNAWVALGAVQLKAGKKAAALDAIKRATELNPANKRQLPKNPSFEAIRADSEFKRITESVD